MCVIFCYYFSQLVEATWLCILISVSGDVQLSLKPKNKSEIKFSICHGNLNSNVAHNYAKFESSIASDDGNLKISWYHLIRSEDPPNSKRGGVCICYKSIILLTVLNIHYLQEFISFELKISDKLFNLISLHRFPRQTQNEFETFSEYVESIVDCLFQNNPFLILVINDFNVKSSNW